MNALWISLKEIELCRESDGKTLEITDSNRLEHMLEILDVEVNDTIKVCLINHGIADATVCSIKNDKIILLLNKKIQDYSTSQKQVER
jgi:16S rRNA U1498 N3-methylase RsmE